MFEDNQTATAAVEFIASEIHRILWCLNGMHKLSKYIQLWPKTLRLHASNLGLVSRFGRAAESSAFIDGCDTC